MSLHDEMRRPSGTVWSSITLGNLRDIGAVEEALTKANYVVSDDAREALHDPKFRLENAPLQLDLCLLSGSQLGFTRDATTEQIFARALAWEFLLCPPEVGPQLRLQYRSQPDGEAVAIAMRPLAPFGTDRLFSVGHKNGQEFLGTCRGLSGWYWAPYVKFVFQLRS